MSEVSGAEVLQIAASVNSESEHPIARAIVNEAKRKNSTLSSVGNFQRIAGKGAKATIDDNDVFVGSEALLGDYNPFFWIRTHKKDWRIIFAGQDDYFYSDRKENYRSYRAS